MKKVGIVLGIAGLATGLGIGVVVPTQAAGSSDSSSTVCTAKEYTMGLRYQQKSAEVKAVQRQSYALATVNLDRMVKRVPRYQRHRLVVMTDLDETVLNNTPLFVRDMNACHDFTAWDTWSDWEIYGNPKLIPGARAFLKHADRLGVTIYYVSGRYNENKRYTMATLRHLDLPQVKGSQVKLQFNGPPKSVIRKDIQRHHKLIMQLGDSLADFSGAFEGATLAKQRAEVRQNAGHFGRDWIILPDSAYGSWTSANLTPWGRPLG